MNEAQKDALLDLRSALDSCRSARVKIYSEFGSSQVNIALARADETESVDWFNQYDVDCFLREFGENTDIYASHVAFEKHIVDNEECLSKLPKAEQMEMIKTLYAMTKANKNSAVNVLKEFPGFLASAETGDKWAERARKATENSENIEGQASANEREDFEKFARLYPWFKPGQDKKERDDSVFVYEDPETDTAWMSWQASRCAVVVQAPDYCDCCYTACEVAENFMQAINDAGMRVES